MLKRSKLTLIAAGIVATISATAPALADGFLAGLARDAGLISEDQRRALDDAHAAMGRPLDHLANQVAGAAADYVVPGSGVYVTQGLEMRDRFNRSGVGPVAMDPVPVMPAPQTVGNFCTIPGFGHFGPGPINPLGARCNVMTPVGLVWGQVTL